MESETFEILDNILLIPNLEQNYIKELVSLIKEQLKPLYNQKLRYKLKPSLLKKHIYKYLQKKYNLSKELIDLSKIPQPEQRTEAWHNFRNNKITASSAAKIIGWNPHSTRRAYLQEKLGLSKPFKGNKFTLHGTKFEQVATTCYELRNNLIIFEFGSIPHPKYDFIAASPDGISNNEPIMLEIKVPPRRQIKDDEIPTEYQVQMQLQLEVANLEKCDFLQMRIDNIEKEEYYNNEDDILLNELGLEKGFIIIGKMNNSFKEEYLYPDRESFRSFSKMQEWKQYIYDLYGNKYDKLYPNYWSCKKYSLQRVYRDKEFFEEHLPEFKRFWDEILKYRKEGIPENLYPRNYNKVQEDEHISHSKICTIESSSDEDEDKDNKQTKCTIETSSDDYEDNKQTKCTIQTSSDDDEDNSYIKCSDNTLIEIDI